MEFAKKAAVNGKMLDVVSSDTYDYNRALYGNINSAVEIQNPRDGATYILPVRSQTDDRPGIYNDGSLSFCRFPESEEERQIYRKDNINVIDYSDVESTAEFIEKQKQLRSIEDEILSDIDSVFIPPLLTHDSAEMRALKNAVTAKQCDINKYQGRFGDNFLNDRRIFKGNKITMNKLIQISDCLDMEVELIIRDKSPYVPNPMKKEIRAILTGGLNDD